MKLITIILLSFLFISAIDLHAAVHTGQLEVGTFIGRQQAQRDHNATFSGGLQFGLEVVEVGVIEFSAENAFSSYPDNNQKARNFDIALRSNFYSNDLFAPFILGGFGLMTYNKPEKGDSDSSVSFAKTTTNFGFGFKARIQKEFFGRFDVKYNLFSKDGVLTYRSLIACGVAYSF